jgi:polyisoprenoid-binding protein YceI
MRFTNTKMTLALATVFALSQGALAATAKKTAADKAAANTTVSKTVAIDPAASALKWEGTKVTGKHNGTVQLKDGELVLEGNELKGGKFTIDMTSIVDKDVEDPKNRAKLENHLKSDDFFDVAKYPTSTVKIKEAKSVPGFVGPTFEVVADVTIKGKTNEVKFPATVETKDGKTVAKANITIDRTKWDVRYGSGKFFQGLGDKMIHDDFKLDVALASN